MPEPYEVNHLFASAASIAEETKSKPYKVLLKYFPNLENWNYWVMTITIRRDGYATMRNFDIESGTVGSSRRMESLCILPVRKVTD
jgi:hypothetical protein